MKNIITIIIILYSVCLFSETEIIIPSGKNAKTQKDFENTKYLFLKKNIVEHFAKFANKKASYYDATKQFLDDFCKYYTTNLTSNDLEKLLTTGENLLKTIYPQKKNIIQTDPMMSGYDPMLQNTKKVDDIKCNTQIVKAVYGILLLENRKYDKAKEYLNNIEDELEKEKVSKYFLAIIANNILKINLFLYDDNKDYYNKTIEAISTFLMSKEYNDDRGRLALDLIEKSYITAKYNDFKIKAKILKKIDEKQKLDNWIKLVLSADIDINNAWEIRTHDAGKNITDDMRTGFHNNIAIAYPKYIKAWDLYPQFPEVSARMIEVACIRKNRSSMEFWFNRCMQAQIDYEPAYIQ